MGLDILVYDILGLDLLGFDISRYNHKIIAPAAHIDS